MYSMVDSRSMKLICSLVIYNAINLPPRIKIIPLIRSGFFYSEPPCLVPIKLELSFLLRSLGFFISIENLGTYSESALKGFLYTSASLLIDC